MKRKTGRSVIAAAIAAVIISGMPFLGAEPREAAAATVSFTDVAAGYWAYDDIDFACSNEESDGYGEYTMYEDSCDCWEESR